MILPITKKLNWTSSALHKIKEIVNEIITDDNVYPKKFRGKNFYKKPSPELREIVEKLLASHDEFNNLVWYFEVFVSHQPVGLHNDRNLFEQIGERCDRGFVIPIDIVGNNHHTKFYDIIIDEKVNWNGKEFMTLDGTLKEIDHNALLESNDVMWGVGDVLFFDARQIHQAGAFNNDLGEYKISINGLGYSKI